MTTSIEDLKTRKFWVALFAEFLGTLTLVLVGCGACGDFYYQVAVKVNENRKSNDELEMPRLPADYVQIALAFGLSVATIVWCIAHVSCGHINPAVTIGFLVTRKISIVRALLYIVCQTLGAIVGAGLLRAVTPSQFPLHATLGACVPQDGLNDGKAFFVEFCITFVLVWTVFATCDSQRKGLDGSGPLAIGLSITMCHLFAIPLTGSGMNPARVFGPALVSGTWNSHWIYWIGPLLGGAAAALLYDFVFATNATLQKLVGFFSRNYDDSKYDATGKISQADDSKPAAKDDAV